jgi:hypothetical protein
MIYPIPNWSERIYKWKINNDKEFIHAIVIASVCSFILITLIITISIHHKESDIRMLKCSHMVAICIASMVVIWSLVFLWQSDMNIVQCASYLWCVHLPTSFVIQMMNMKAYRLSVYMHLENKYRFKKLNHNSKYTSMETLINHFKHYSEGVKVPRGFVYKAVEAPKGEFGVSIVSDGTSMPYRCKIRTPAYHHMQVMPRLVQGHFFADLVTVLGSQDIVFGDVDR